MFVGLFVAGNNRFLDVLDEYGAKNCDENFNTSSGLLDNTDCTKSANKCLSSG